MTKEIRVPDIGDFASVEIIEILAAPGDELEAEQALLVLESDKATMEVPSPVAGTLRSLSVKLGDKVAQGDLIGVIELATTTTAPPPAADRPAQAPAAPPLGSTATRIEASGENKSAHSPEKNNAANDPGPSTPGQIPHASPSIRLFARELGVDLSLLSGSGPKGRILKQDVQSFVKNSLQNAPSGTGSGLPRMPSIDFSKFGETESVQMPRIRKLSAANLHRNWLVVPHVTQFESADISELESFRKAESASADGKLTLLPFVLKAASIALRTYPEFNSSMDADGSQLILKKYCHIGFAAETPQGLVVPVIRDVDKKSVRELGTEAAELAAIARAGKLGPAQMQGGCFSVSSLGGIGGSFFTPIVNAPEVAILGVSRAKTEAIWNGAEFRPRLMLPLSLSYDHRVIDGAAAARFAVLISRLLSDIRRLCL